MKPIFYITGLLLTLLSSCSSYSLVHSEDYSRGYLVEAATFSIVSLKMGQLPPGMDIATFGFITDAIRAEMTSRGYEESEKSPLFINIGVTVHYRVTSGSGEAGPYCSTTYPCYIYPREHYWNDHYLESGIIDGIYRKGVLTIDVVNMKERRPLYTSSVATIVDENGDYGEQEIPVTDFYQSVNFYQTILGVELMVAEYGNEKMACFVQSGQTVGAISYAPDFKPSKHGVLIHFKWLKPLSLQNASRGFQILQAM